MKLSSRPVHILLVEDNPGDIRLTKEVFKDSKIYTQISVVTDGEAVMPFLRREGEYSNAVQPDLILLDLNLPRRSGREVLNDIKSDPILRRIPVIVLSTSKAEEDISKAYDSYANCYISKPVDLDEFSTIVNVIEDFWFNAVELPEELRPLG